MTIARPHLGRERPSGGFELYSWYYFRISGLLLILLAVGHVVIMHVVNTVDEIDWQFADRWWLLVDEVGHDGAILGEEGLHVHDEVADDAKAEQRLDRDLRPEVLDEHLAGQSVAPIDTHGVGTTDAVRAAAAEGQAAILVPLDVVERIEDPISRFDLDRVLAVVRFGIGFGIEPLDTQRHLHLSTPVPSARTA